MTTGRLLFALLALGTCGSACSGLTEPASTLPVAVEKEPVAEAPATATAPPAPTPPPPAPVAAPAGDTVTAAHILIAYKGSLRADPSIDRTKDAAKARATKVLIMARKGDDFGKLADEMSDDPSAKRNHGSLGRFTREQMVKPFSDAAFALKPGAVSELVETPFGFHVIKRTE